MKKVSGYFQKVFTGQFLASEQWLSNWPFIIFLSLLALVMINSSHQAERKVHEIAKLKKELKELNSEFLDTRSRLMQESLESKVVGQASLMGLEQANTPPILLIENTEE